MLIRVSFRLRVGQKSTFTNGPVTDKEKVESLSVWNQARGGTLSRRISRYIVDSAGCRTWRDSKPTSWVQLICELQRDWQRKETVPGFADILFAVEGTNHLDLTGRRVVGVGQRTRPPITL
jgi:hypothetical protein